MSVILTDKIQPRTTGIALTVVGDTNVSGALTCTNFTASGDVSIGGTLTYEDVTNIDSVGLITARTGVRVTAGGVVVTAGVSTFTDDVKVNSTLTATEGINVTAGVSTFTDDVKVNSTLTATEGINVSAGVGTFAGDVSIADKIIHTGDTNTAIRFPAADNVSVETGGTERARITSDGELLVALTAGDGVAPDARLQVRGDSHTKSKIQVLATHNDDNPGTFVIAKSRGSGNVILGDNDDIGQLDFAGNDGNGYHIVGRIAVTSSGEGNGNDDLPTVMRFFTTSNGGVTNSERLRIDSTGGVRINNTRTTATKLQVVGGTGSGTAYDVAVFAGGQNSTSGSGARIYLSGCENDPIDRGTVIEGVMTNNSNAHALIFKTSASSAAPTERLRITSSGTVGIGTNNPQLNLHIHAESSNASFAHFTNSTTGVSGSDGVSIGLDSDENAVIYNYESSAIRFATGGTERARIDSSGNLSFAGDTNTYISHPSADQLAITVAGGSYPIARFGTGGGGGTVGLSTSITLVTNAEKLAVRGYSSFKSVSKDYAAIYLGSEGDTDGSANALMLFNNGGANRGGIGYVPNTGELRFNNQYFHTFCTGASTLNGTERVRITAAGFVGINNTSPDAWLHIDRSDQQTDNHGTLKIENTSTDTAFNAGLTVMNYQGTSQFMQWTQSGLRMGSRIVTNTGNGHVSITRGGDTVALTIDGANGNFTGSSSANISDGRLKKNIVGITSATATLKQLVGKTFKWIPEAKFDTKTKYGFIAQEVKSVIPDLVYQDLSINRVSTASTAQDYGKGILIDDNSADFSDDSKSEWSMSVETNGIIPILVEAFKELETRISALESS